MVMHSFKQNKEAEMEVYNVAKRRYFIKKGMNSVKDFQSVLFFFKKKLIVTVLLALGNIKDKNNFQKNKTACIMKNS